MFGLLLKKSLKVGAQVRVRARHKAANSPWRNRAGQRGHAGLDACLDQPPGDKIVVPHLRQFRHAQQSRRWPIPNGG